jgi:hypothetical protein
MQERQETESPKKCHVCAWMRQSAQPWRKTCTQGLLDGRCRCGQASFDNEWGSHYTMYHSGTDSTRICVLSQICLHWCSLLSACQAAMASHTRSSQKQEAPLHLEDMYHLMAIESARTQACIAQRMPCIAWLMPHVLAGHSSSRPSSTFPAQNCSGTLPGRSRLPFSRKSCGLAPAACFSF